MFALLSAFVLTACSDTVTPTVPARLPAGPSLAMDPAVCNGATMPVAECQALVSLYNSTNGPGWIDDTGWGTANPCTWSGIVCTNGDQGSVRIIMLTSNELTGQLPDALGALTSLEHCRDRPGQVVPVAARFRQRFSTRRSSSGSGSRRTR